MIVFKPKINHQKPIKPLQKADFNAYFAKKWMIFTLICKIHATPKGPFRVRFPAGVPNKKEPSGSFLFGFRCGNQPAVRPTACGGTRSAATKYSRRKPCLPRAFGLFFVWLSVRKPTRGSTC